MDNIKKNIEENSNYEQEFEDIYKAIHNNDIDNLI